MGQPQQFGRYELLGELARGGMGAVYRARDVELGREVAIKVITTPLDGEALARFQLEGEAAARVRHPNVLRVHERGVHQGRPFLVMDLAAGSLRERLRKSGPMSGTEAVAFLLPIVKALGQVHAAQILHRDLKPENILLSEEGQPLLADFGIAKAVDRETRYTQTGALMGSPAYMAPEQADGSGAMDERVDVYGVGAILYELLTGRAPFVAGSLVGVLAAVLSDPPQPPSRLAAGLAPEIEAVCLRCLEKEPAARFANMSELAQALDEAGVSARQSSLGRRGGIGLPGLLVIGLLLIGLVGLLWGLRGGLGSATPSPAAAIVSFEVRQVGATSPEGVFELEVVFSGELSEPGLLDLHCASERLRRVLPREGRETYRLRATRGGSSEWKVRLKKTKWAANVKVECPDLPEWYLKLEPPPPLLVGLRPAAEKEEYVNRVDQSQMIWIPPGRSLVAIHGEHGSSQVTRGFYLGKYEVSAAQVADYRRAVGLPAPKERSATRPAYRVSFHEATRYCRWAGGRLPTIQEWNLAAWGDRDDPDVLADPEHRLRSYPWGDSPPSQEADLGTEAERPGPLHRPYDRTPRGVIGMGGGVSEWVADVNPETSQGLVPDLVGPSKPAPHHDPKLSSEAGRLRELRGGSFLREPNSAAARYHPSRPAARIGTPHSVDRDWRKEQGARLVRSPWRPEPPPLQWKVEFLTFEGAQGYQDQGIGPPPSALTPVPGEVRCSVLLNPWLRRLPRAQGFVTRAQSQVELPAGRWVFSVVNVDDGIRLKVRAGGKVLAELDKWLHQVVRHYEVVVEVEEETLVEVEVEHCQLQGGAGLWVELSRE